MINEAAEHVREIVEPLVIGTAVEDLVFWSLAPQGLPAPFVVFDVSDDGVGSKDRLVGIGATVKFVGKSITEAAQLGTAFRNALREEKKGWKDRGATSGYTDTEAKEGYIEITYNFNL